MVWLYLDKLPLDWWRAFGVGGAPSVEREKLVVFVVEGVSIGPDYVFASGVRLKGRGRRLAIKYLLERDGRMCQGFCKGQVLPMDERNIELVKADIDHIDTRHRPLHIAKNLRLLCHNCNSQVWHHSQKKQTGLSSIGERESEKRRLGHLHVLPDVGDGYSSVKNAEVEPLFRKWVFEMVKVHRGEDYLTRGNLVCDGGELIGFNPKSGYPYFGRLVAPIYGCLEWGWSKSSKRIVQFRLEADYSLSADELCDKYPWEGQRFALDHGV